MSDDWDFGFTAVDDIPTTPTTPSDPVVAQVDDQQLQTLLDKMERLESLIISSDDSDMINEHRELVQQDVVTKLKQVEDLILPLLFNLQKNPEKDYIHWPGRTAIIDKQIEKIKAVTRYYDNV
tara:strand:+ start:770 stop:1138 length:369 start_codon:yes stop_codon:yes gene_type:complete